MALTQDERSILDELDVKQVFGHIEWLVDQAPGRYAGSEDETKSAQYIQNVLSDYDVDSHIYDVDAYLGVPGKSELHILAPEKRDLLSSPRAPTSGSSVSGEVVLVESGEEARRHLGNMRSKIILAPYSYMLPITPEQIVMEGGVGMILGNWGPADSNALRVTAPQTWIYWGVPTSEIFRATKTTALPQIFVSPKDYQYLRNLCKRETLKASFTSNIASKWDKVHMVLGEVSGRNTSDDFLLLGSHHDSWNPGASDDAAGVAVMLELARVFRRNSDRLKRKIRFAFVSGHENGAYATSTWYLDNFWEDIDEHAVVFAVYDTPGFKNAPEYKIEVTEELSGFALVCAQDIVNPDVKVNVHRANKTADRGFFGIGVPSIYTRNAFSKEQIDKWGGAFLGYWNHSAEDTIDKLGKQNMSEVMRIRALETFRLCKYALLPYNFEAVVDGFVERLEEWRRLEDSLNLSDTIEYTCELRDGVTKLNEVLKDTKPSGVDLDKANTLLKKLSRLLTQINYTTKGRYGQDILGTDLTRPLVALKDADQVESLEKGSPEQIMLLTKLVKEKNRVNDALRESVLLISSFLASV